MPLLPGARLGPYETLAPLGAGGMGEVWRARDSRLDRDVAIKVLPEHLARDQAALSRFEREAKVLAALSHPNVLGILDFGREGELVYAVAELLEGKTLRSRLTTTELSWREATKIGVAMAEGLAAAHARGIVHRDLKPENVFLTSDGRVKILDFGLARRDVLSVSATASVNPTLMQETLPGTVMGTVGYMAPEQVSGEPADARSDIFSFGCVLYEMVTGSRAFPGRNSAETIASILRDDPADPRASGKSFPADLTRVVAHCLAREPAQRFQSAQDLAFDLNAVLAGSAVSAPVSAQPLRRFRRIWMPLAAMVLVGAIAGLVLATRHARQTARAVATTTPIRSLAVLPLENLSNDSEQEYFADGMTEELSTQLAQIRALKVISRTSVMKYKKSAKTMPEIGRELKVDAIVTGTVLRSGGKVRITAHLIRASTDDQIWAESFNRDLEDVLVLQGDVARAIVERIRVKTTPQEVAHLSRGRPIDPAAYEAYLKGRFYWHRGRTPEYMSKTVEYFREAIEKDAQYAAAYAGLADTYLAFGTFGMLLSSDANRNARPAAMKALELDPQSAEAHATLARIRAAYDWDWPGAESEFRRALELNPSSPDAHQWYGVFLVAVGRNEEAILQVKRAVELDPFSLVANNTLEFTYYLAHLFDQAIEQGGKTIQLDASYSPAYQTMGDAYEAKGMPERAFSSYQKWAETAGFSAQTIAALKQAFESGGMKGYWQKRLEMEKREEAETGNVWPMTMAQIHTRLGERDKAFVWLEKMYSERHERLHLLRPDPVFDGLHSDPRFIDLMERIGLPL